MTGFTLRVMMYHYVRDPGDDAEAGTGIPGLATATFEAQLDELARQQYEVIGWPVVRDHLLNGAALPERACLLTFDDGTRDHYLNVFPALRARGWSGLFFALAREPGQGMPLGHKLHFLLARGRAAELRQATLERLGDEGRQAYLRAEAHYQAVHQPGEIDLLKYVLQRDLSDQADPILSELFAERIGDEVQIASNYYLTAKQIAEMVAEGMHFGGHSRSHPWLDFISAERQREEIGASAAWLGRVEAGPWAFAYPYGGIGVETPGLVQDGGFAAAFTTRTQTTHTDLYWIGRIDGEEWTPGRDNGKAA
jgi:peptidoglycan/xylan/chitin deacetylase (PgdA/CDA1 family)